MRADRITLALVFGFLLPVGAGRPTAAPRATAYFAGGCFWGVESVFEHLRGVKSVVSGFGVPQEDTVISGGRPLRHSGYAESVKVEYDSTEISYQQLLEVFFLVVHDPTEVDRQGPDQGPEYRSLVFVDDTVRAGLVRGYIARLQASGAVHGPVATEVVRLGRFRVAPEAHQDFAARHPDDPYVRINDVPKLAALQRQYPQLYR